MRYIANNLEELEMMTLREYGLRLEAYQLKQKDKAVDFANQAFIARKVNEKVEVGRGKKKTIQYKNQTIEDVLGAAFFADKKQNDKFIKLHKIRKNLEKYNKERGHHERI